jgi:hypothetical protein
LLQLIPLLNVALKVGIKQKALSGANKLDIKKMDTQLHVTLIELVEELNIPLLTFNNIMPNKNNILQQGGSGEPSRTNNYLTTLLRFFSCLRSLYSLVPWKNF